MNRKTSIESIIEANRNHFKIRVTKDTANEFAFIYENDIDLKIEVLTGSIIDQVAYGIVVPTDLNLEFTS